MDSIFSQPWLCSTMKNSSDYCQTNDGHNVDDQSIAQTDRVTIEGLNLQGLKMVYYPVEHGNKVGHNGYDRVFGEDNLEEIYRSFYFSGYTEKIPPNVRTYKIEGIWGEDVVTIYAAIAAFNYFSTYGGADRNTPEVYEEREPKIGDVIYLPNNEMFYEVRDVKYFDAGFGLAKHTYTLTCRVYKDTKITVLGEGNEFAESNIQPDDPIYRVATSGYPAQTQTDDILKLNDKLTPEFLENNGNHNLFNYLWEDNT